jgi:hypothetical protein
MAIVAPARCARARLFEQGPTREAEGSYRRFVVSDSRGSYVGASIALTLEKEASAAVA